MMFLPIAFSIRYHITRHIYSRILATCGAERVSVRLGASSDAPCGCPVRWGVSSGRPGHPQGASLLTSTHKNGYLAEKSRRAWGPSGIIMQNTLKCHKER